MSTLETEGHRGRSFDRDFESEFRDWCENRAHGEFSKESLHQSLQCSIDGNVVGVRQRSVIPFDTYAYVDNDVGSVGVTSVDDYDTDGREFTFTGSQETLHVGLDAQVEMDFHSHVPSQHERSTIRDREITRSENVSDTFAF